jgi:hypothetical protein
MLKYSKLAQRAIGFFVPCSLDQAAFYCLDLEADLDLSRTTKTKTRQAATIR